MICYRMTKEAHSCLKITGRHLRRLASTVLLQENILSTSMRSRLHILMNRLALFMQSSQQARKYWKFIYMIYFFQSGFFVPIGLYIIIYIINSTLCEASLE